MNAKLKPTKADNEIAACIDGEISFSVIAGAGSGKTTSLVEALKRIKDLHGRELKKMDNASYVLPIRIGLLR